MRILKRTYNLLLKFNRHATVYYGRVELFVITLRYRIAGGV